MASPLLAIVLRRTSGGAWLDQSKLEALAKHAGSHNPRDWFVDRTEGFAILEPDLKIDALAGTGQCAALAIRGTVHTKGRMSAPAGWSLTEAKNGTESVLYDLLERDVQAIEAMRGSFVLVFWDGRRRRLAIARDHLGIRQLYIRVEHDAFVISSDIDVLIQSNFSRTSDPESLYWYLLFGASAPGKTLFKNVLKVRAATAVTIGPSGVHQEVRYWTPLDPNSPTEADNETINRLRTTFDTALARSMQHAGMRPALLLSGGIDSTYLASRLWSAGVRPASYTIRFEPELGANEHEYAALAAHSFGLEHIVVDLRADKAVQLLQTTLFNMAEPSSAWAALSHAAILNEAKAGDVTHLWSGLGADEVFGGYDHFRLYYARLLRRSKRVAPPLGMHPVLAVALDRSLAASRALYPGVARFLDETSTRNALGPAFRNWDHRGHLLAFYRSCLDQKSEANAMELMVAHEAAHRIPDLLMTIFESLGRRFTINSSHPYLDPDVVRMASGLSPESRYRTKSGVFHLDRRRLHPAFKWAMVQMANGRIPPEILVRPRKSYTAPFGGWLRTPVFRRLIRELTRGNSFFDMGLIDRPWFEHRVNTAEWGPGPRTHQVWATMTLAAWHKHFIDRRA